MRQNISVILLILLCAMSVPYIPAHAADKKVSPNFENAQLSLRLVPRSTEQMAAFFEARGFPPVMSEHLSAYCFFTVIIKNKMKQQLWLDLSKWTFSVGQRHLPRMPRSKWPPIWKKLHIPQASQATFRWTLLPESLQFYENESEGGNIIVQRTNESFVLRASFGLGDGNEVMIASIDDLRCADAAGAAQ